MALLNPSPVLALPETMWLVFHAVAEFGPLSEDDLFALVSPVAIRNAVADGAVPPPTNAARVALRELRDLRLVVNDAGHVATASGTRPASYRAFCAVLRTAVLDTVADDPPLDEAGANDVLRALSGLLAADPTGPPWTEALAALESVPARSGTNVFVNPTRINAFRFWADALGFAEEAVGRTEGGTALVPNPTRALRDFVTATYRPGDDVPAARLLADLRAAFPVLPGGATSRALGYAADPREVDRATAYALCAGETRGWLKLDRRADAADVVLLPAFGAGEAPRPVSDVVVQAVLDV